MSNKPKKSAPSGVSRVAAARNQSQSRTTTFLIVGVVLVLGVALLVAVIATGSDGDAKTATPAEKSAIVDQIQSIPASVYDEVGKGNTTAAPKPITGDALTADGKPEVLFIGAEFCPFCAGERWSLASALARFGKFENLGTTKSASADVFPNTASISFYGSSYTSEFITFTSIEAQTNVRGDDGNYTQLETVTPEQNAIWAREGGNSYPFVDIGGKYTAGASYDVGLLKGKSASEIATALSDPSSEIAKGAIGGANAVTAAICQITEGQPGEVCNSSAVKAAALAG